MFVLIIILKGKEFSKMTYLEFIIISGVSEPNFFEVVCKGQFYPKIDDKMKEYDWLNNCIMKPLILVTPIGRRYF